MHFAKLHSPSIFKNIAKSFSAAAISSGVLCVYVIISNMIMCISVTLLRVLLVNCKRFLLLRVDMVVGTLLFKILDLPLKVYSCSGFVLHLYGAQRKCDTLNPLGTLGPGTPHNSEMLTSGNTCTFSSICIINIDYKQSYESSLKSCFDMQKSKSKRKNKLVPSWIQTQDNIATLPACCSVDGSARIWGRSLSVQIC